MWLVATALCLSSAEGRSADTYMAERSAMVEKIAAYSAEHRVSEPRILDAMRRVPRHEFVPLPLRRRSYDDSPLPIGEGQTISQPFIVGFMTQLLDPKNTETILEVGTGSGYQAAVLSLLVKEVYSIEILPGLGKRAENDLRRLGFSNVKVRIGDGYQGWPEKAPFDAIIVTCAPDHVPAPLVAQLKAGGRLVIPVGPEGSGDADGQELILIRKTKTGLIREKRLPVRFVPMTGKARPGGL